MSMMMSSNGNIFRVTGYLCGECTGPRWIPGTEASDAELWCFLSSASESLKRKCCHFDEILITDCTESCHFDNFRCSQWWKFRQNDDISVSVINGWINTRETGDLRRYRAHYDFIVMNVKKILKNLELVHRHRIFRNGRVDKCDFFQLRVLANNNDNLGVN